MDMSQVCEGGGNVNEPCGVDCSMYSDYVYSIPPNPNRCMSCVCGD